MSNPKDRTKGRSGAADAPAKKAPAKTAVKKAPAKKPPAAPAAAPGVRQRGRPARLSQQAVITKTLELLADRLPDEITLALLAEELQTATVSLYKYFPNRDALLDAVAEYFYSLFEFPEPDPKQPWQDTALDWLWAVHDHIERRVRLHVERLHRLRGLQRREGRGTTGGQ